MDSATNSLKSGSIGRVNTRKTVDQHIERHKMLHKRLDELVADFITETEKRPSSVSLIEFIGWSQEQTVNPSDKQGIFVDA